MSEHAIKVVVNGVRHHGRVPSRKLLVHYLRDDLRLTSVHVGCDSTQCGACTVHVDGHAVKSCTVLAVQADGSTLGTVEGVATDGVLHPLQQAFQDCHALQCGFCTPGMIMSSLDLLERYPDPSDAQVRAWLKGNFCRCTGYQHIIEAIRSVGHGSGSVPNKHAVTREGSAQARVCHGC